jgi:hypothetical protein
MLMAAGPTALAKKLSAPLVVPDGALDVEAELEHLVPDGFSSEERSKALVMFGEAIGKAAAAAIQTSSGGVRAVLDALGDGGGTLLPFVGPGDGSEAAHAKAREIAQGLESSLVNVTKDADPVLRARAVTLLGRSRSDMAVAAIVQALRDESDVVRRAALASIGAHVTPAVVAAVSDALAHHERFAIRVLAAQALGRLGAAHTGDVSEGVRVLEEAAVRDEYALVREASLAALASFDLGSAKRVAARIVASDPEPRVRDTAQAVLSGTPISPAEAPP